MACRGWEKDKLKIGRTGKNVDKLAEDILNIVKIISERENKKAEKAYVYAIPPEKKIYEENAETLKKKTGLDVIVFAVNDKNKIDPENKAGKAKMGKPAIFLQ